MEKEALPELWERRTDGRVVCNACYRRCAIGEGSHGFCYVRQVHDGKLWLSVYAKLAAMQIDPVEKKPFLMFHPGTKVFTVGTVSCSWMCKFCENSAISKETQVYGIDVPPGNLSDYAIAEGCQGVGFSYNEPTIFLEYVLDAARDAHRKGLYTVFVTNGYTTADAVKLMGGVIDAVVVDYKGSGEENFQRRITSIVSTEPVKQSLMELKRQGIHIEMTDLIIPKVGEDLRAAESLMKWVYDNLGPDIPVQFTQFHPDYKMTGFPCTPYETLVRHHEVGKKAGLRYVHIGNIPGNPYEHTYCPGCGAPVIERHGFTVTGWHLDKDYRCQACGYQIPITGKPAERFEYRPIEAYYIPNPKGTEWVRLGA